MFPMPPTAAGWIFLALSVALRASKRSSRPIFNGSKELRSSFEDAGDFMLKPMLEQIACATGGI